jgi:hypothetical protein
MTDEQKTQPAATAWLVDPGLGSAIDRLQRTAPSEVQLQDIEDRCGSVEPLYTMDQMRDYALAFHKSRVDASNWIKASERIPEKRPGCECSDDVLIAYRLDSGHWIVTTSKVSWHGKLGHTWHGREPEFWQLMPAPPKEKA